jgi:hypothetical protein
MSTVSGYLDRLLEPFAESPSAEVAQRWVGLRADAAMQSRLDYLAERCSSGQITDEEREEYANYVQALDVIAVLQAKARAVLRKVT